MNFLTAVLVADFAPPLCVPDLRILLVIMDELFNCRFHGRFCASSAFLAVLAPSGRHKKRKKSVRWGSRSDPSPSYAFLTLFCSPWAPFLHVSAIVHYCMFTLVRLLSVCPYTTACSLACCCTFPACLIFRVHWLSQSQSIPFFNLLVCNFPCKTLSIHCWFTCLWEVLAYAALCSMFLEPSLPFLYNTYFFATFPAKNLPTKNQ